MSGTETIITLVNEGQLNQEKKADCCPYKSYQYKKNNIFAIFIFYVSLVENHQTLMTENIDFSSKEIAKINEVEKQQKISNGKTYHFAYRYSDFIEVDPNFIKKLLI